MKLQAGIISHGNFPLINANWFRFSLIPALLFLLNSIYKYAGIEANAIAGDEPHSIYVALQDIPFIWKYLSTGNNAPLYEILLHYWVKLVGIDVIPVRIPSLLFSSLTVVVLYASGLRFFNFKTGCLAALLFIFSNYQTIFAQEARAYAMFMFITSCTVYSFLNYLHKPHSRTAALVFSSCLLVLLYTHFFAFFLVFVFGLLLLLNIKKIRQHFRVILFSLGIPFIGYLPYLLVFVNRLFISTNEGTWVHPVESLGNLSEVIYQACNTHRVLLAGCVGLFGLITAKHLLPAIRQTTGRILLSAFLCVSFFSFASVYFALPFFWKVTTAFSFILLLLLGFICITALAIYKHKIDSAHQTILLWLILPLSIMFLVSFKIPMFTPRYTSFVLPAFYLLLARALLYFYDQVKLIPALFCLVLFINNGRCSVYNERQTDRFVALYSQLKSPSTITYICPDYFDLNFTYYYNRDYFREKGTHQFKQQLIKRLAGDHIYPLHDFKQIDTLQFTRFKTILFLDIRSNGVLPGNGIEQLLNRSAIPLKTYQIPEIFSIRSYRIPDTK